MIFSGLRIFRWSRFVSLFVLSVFILTSFFPPSPTVFAARSAGGGFDLSGPEAPVNCTGTGCGSAPVIFPEDNCKKGSLPGEGGVNCTGAATYEISIPVPPGSADMQPNLSLSYNSQGGNGLLGVGWSISGLSSITRCPANMVLDGFRGTINYDQNDRYCLDGQRLIPIAPFGGAIQEYRTEPETFARIKSFGTTTTGASYFTVEAKSGMITEYGNTADSKIEALGNTEVRVWAEDRVSNRTGNYIDFIYSEDSVNGQYYPIDIRYTGNAAAGLAPYNSVKFEYINFNNVPGPLVDPVSFYQGGSVVKQTKLLSKVKTCLSATTTCTGLVNEYKLSYQVGNATNRFQLKSVQLCDNTGIVAGCFPATTMNWSDENRALTGSTPTTWASGFGGNDGTFMDAEIPLTLDAFVAPLAAPFQAPDTVSQVIGAVSFISSPVGALVGLVINGIVTFYQWLTTDYKLPKARLGDVDGDGKTDVIGFTDSIGAPDTEDVLISNGLSAFNEQVNWKTWTDASWHPNAPDPINSAEPEQVKLGDFNGDGIMDIMSYEDVTGSVGTLDGVVYFSNGSSAFTKSPLNSSGEPAFMAHDSGDIRQNGLADFNGDGKTDVAGFLGGFVYLTTDTGISRQDGAQSSSTWQSCVPGLNCSNTQTNYPLENVIMGDVNGDGKTDLVHIDSSGTNTHAKIWLTNKLANGWTTSGSPAADYDFGFNVQTSSDIVQSGDFNGDGKMDIIIFPHGSTITYDTDGDGQVESNGDDVSVTSGGTNVYLSNGRTFVRASSFDSILNIRNSPYALEYPTNSYIESFLARLADFNGDGKTDIIVFDPTDGPSVGVTPPHTPHEAHLFLSDGTKFRPEFVWANGNLIDEMAIGDFDGDSKADVLHFSGGSYNGQLNVMLNNKYDPDLLTGITDGFGKKDEFDYKLVNDFQVYQTENDNSLAGFDSETYKLRGGLYVVSDHRVSDGIGGTYARNYVYYNGKSNRSFGFLGFSKIVIVDSQLNIQETVEYDQHYPLVCHIKSKTIVLRTCNNGCILPTLNKKTMGWSVINGTALGGAPHIIRLDSENNVDYELDGVTQTKNNTYTYTYDTYNNITNLTTSWIEKDSNGTVISSYVADVLANTYYNSSATWVLGLPLTTTDTRGEPIAMPSRTVTRTFNTTTGLLLTSNEQLAAGRSVVTSYTRDSFGNSTQVAVSGTDISTRNTNITYDSKGRFPATIQNALGQNSSVSFDSRFGGISSMIDPNILTTSWAYDVFGREILETRPDGTNSSKNYCVQSEGNYKSGTAVTWIQSKTSGLPDQTFYFDSLGREVREATIGFDGASRINQDSLYDSNLRLSKVSIPFYSPPGLSSYFEYSYDPLGRVTTEAAPNGTIKNFSYAGGVMFLESHPFSGLSTIPLLWHQVTEKNALGNQTDYVVNRLGQVNQINSRDSGGALVSHMTYNYDGYDNPVGMADHNGNVTLRTYVDDHMTTLSDLDSGNSTYAYDVLGKLKTATDAKGNTTSLGYDLLDRLKSRGEAEGTSTWTYDTASIKGIGRLAQTSGPNGFSENYTYDSFGRAVTANTIIPGEGALVTQRSYDSASRLDVLQYPGAAGFKTRNIYNPSGYLSKVQNASTSADIWQAESMNAAGRITSQIQGNSNSGNMTLHSSFKYDKLQNVTEITVGDKIGQLLTFNPSKHLIYTYDSTNNLNDQKRDLIRVLGIPGISKDAVDQYQYDPLNRLTNALDFVNDNILQISEVPRYEKLYAYNGIGNITNKSDLNASTTTNYHYPLSGQGLHAVFGVDDNQAGYPFTYDANGNMLAGRDFQNNKTRTIDWFSFNKPKKIMESQGTSTQSLALTYDSYRDKIKQVFATGIATTTTEYVGSIFEKFINASGSAQSKYYVFGNSPNPVAMYTSGNGTSSMRYFHYDNLGSLTLITNENAGNVEDLSFDVYGVRRNADWTVATSTITSLTNHGFTNQEQIDNFGLIDMKGRMYDPKIGRFISADPFIVDPFMTESLSRYSYVYNSPTNFIDPTGFQVKGGSGPVWNRCTTGNCGGGGGGIAGGIFSGIFNSVVSLSGQEKQLPAPSNLNNGSMVMKNNVAKTDATATSKTTKPIPRPLTPKERADFQAKMDKLRVKKFLEQLEKSRGTIKDADKVMRLNSGNHFIRATEETKENLRNYNGSENSTLGNFIIRASIIFGGGMNFIEPFEGIKSGGTVLPLKPGPQFPIESTH